jgi:hypothetical protein
VTTEKASTGDSIPPKCAIIEVHVAELKQLFNSIDPSPFRNRDLEPGAEEFIVGWSKDFPANTPLALLVYLDRPAGLPDEAAVLRDAIHEFFRQRALATRRQLRQLFRIGRTSMLIGLAFLTMSIMVGNLIATRLGDGGFAEIIRESFLIGGWVAMWRPLEVFLYDWWPIRREAKNFDRLTTMRVRIRYTNDAATEAWRRDWPAASPTQPSPHREAAQESRGGAAAPSITPSPKP